MEANEEHSRYLMPYFYRKDKHVTQDIRCLYSNVLKLKTMQKAFPRFKADDLNLEDQERSIMLFTTNEDLIKTLIENKSNSEKENIVVNYTY